VTGEYAPFAMARRAGSVTNLHVIAAAAAADAILCPSAG